MGRKYGFSFSWKRAIGISGAKWRISKTIGIPLTRSGRQRKVGRAAGCFVATAVYGDYESVNVRYLRAFRDRYLQRSWMGQLFVRFYYRVGPFLAELVEKSPLTKMISRTVLEQIIKLIEICTSLKVQDFVKK